MSSSTGWYAAMLDRVAAEERRKAEAAGGEGVEVAKGVVDGAEVVVVRDGKRPHDAVLVFTPEEWVTFLAGVRAGEFDLPDAGDGPDGSGPGEPQKRPLADSGPSPVSA